MPTQIRPYDATVCPNSRKEALLHNTYNHIQHGIKVWFDFLVSLLGGVDQKIAELSRPGRGEYSPKLACAVNWFRSMVGGTSNETLTSRQLLKRFGEYYGEQPDDLVVEYLTSPIGEGYQWVDCRKKFFSLQRKLKTTTLREDLATLVRVELLPVRGGDSKANTSLKESSRGIASGLFGDGEKNDFTLRVKVLQKVIRQCNKFTPKNYKDIKQLLLECSGSTSREDFKKNFGAVKGSPTFFERIIRGEHDKKELNVEKFLKVCRSACKKFDGGVNYLNKDKIKVYLENAIGGKYYLNSWSVMIKYSLTDIVAKSTRNGSFTFEKRELKSQIAEKRNDKVGLLNGFFQSIFFRADHKFCISPWHLGYLEEFYKFCSAKENSDLPAKVLFDQALSFVRAIEQEKGSKPAITDLLRYIFHHRSDATAKEFLEAAQYNSALSRYNNRKVHPTRIGNHPLYYGESQMNGFVVPPCDKLRNDYCIWVELELLNKGKWEKHHIPLFSSRFYEEVYFYDADSKLPTVPLRTKRFGVDLRKYNLPEKFPSTLRRKNGQSRVKLHRRIERINLATVPNVEWPGKIGFSISKNGKFKAVINYQVASYGSKPELMVGDRIMGIDQGRNRNHAYSVYEIVKSSNKKIGRFCVKLVESGQLGSETKPRRNLSVVDQLTYNGQDKDSPLFKRWVKDRRAFVTSLGVKEVTDEFNRCASKETLYEFNNWYLSLLKKITKGKYFIRINNEIEIPVDLKSLRQEITTMLAEEKGSGSPLWLSSLSDTALSSLGRLKSVVLSYLDRLLGNKDKTEENRELADKELYSYLDKIDRYRQNKRKEKINRSVDAILTIAVNNRVKCLFAENNLPTANKNAKRRTNQKTIDWSARGIANKLKESCSMHGIYCYLINPMYTSHQQPFAHRTKKPVMSCRYELFYEIPDWAVKKLSTYMRATKLDGTARYYLEGVENFIGHYDLEEYREAIKKGTLTGKQLTDICKRNVGSNASIIVPMRLGGYYLAMHDVTTLSKPIMYNGKVLYLSNADEVASLNILIVGMQRFGDSSASKKSGTVSSA